MRLSGSVALPPDAEEAGAGSVGPSPAAYRIIALLPTLVSGWKFGSKASAGPSPCMFLVNSAGALRATAMSSGALAPSAVVTTTGTCAPSGVSKGITTLIWRAQTKLKGAARPPTVTDTSPSL